MEKEIKEIKEIIQPKKRRYRWLIITLVIFFVVLLSIAGASFGLAYGYQNKIYPGVHANGLDLSGMTAQQATKIIDGKDKQSFEKGFKFTYKGKTKTITNEDNEIFELNSEIIAKDAFETGRDKNIVINQLYILVLPIIKHQVEIDYKLDKNLLKEKLSQEFAIEEKLAKDAKPIIEILDETEQLFEIKFEESEIGEKIHFFDALDKLEQNIKDLTNTTIILESQVDEPKVTTALAHEQKDKMHELLKAVDTIEFTYEDEKWETKWSDFTHWLNLEMNEDENIIISLNEEMVDGKLESIAQEINQEAQDAKLQIKNDKVTDFQTHKNGLELNKEESYKIALANITENNTFQVDLVVEVTEPEVKIESINNLGIKEIIGSGWSDYSGSPANRRHNIAVGAASVNGTLIAPGEEFSLVKALGAVDASNGYKPELVIKGNETIPEYGGGLCQVATTVFRGALEAGIDITQRRNHRYRVSYYEPAGTDATIYIPQPDVRFANDTDHHILIQSKLWGNNLVFEFWGTDDGRKVIFEGNNTTSDFSKLQPIIFNITSPGPAKEIETTELAPGVRKRQESAHNGADAVFYRTIIKDGEEEKETYESHYVAWQAVYLVGIDPEQKEKEAQEELEKLQEEFDGENDETAPFEE
jgi:vancomycin resistance protein YoaR